MVTEKEILNFMRGNAARPFKSKGLIKEFQINPDDRSSFRQILKNMVRRGTLIKIKGGRYGIPEKMNLVVGKLQGHPEGFGFVIPEKTNDQSINPPNDIYISARNLKEAMHGDKVVCRIESHRHGEKEEGRIIRILERGFVTLVGTFEKTGNFGFVIPDEKKIAKDIYIPNKYFRKARSGQAVVIEITRYPGVGLNPEGKIIEVLGYPDNPDVEVEIVAKKFGIVKYFPVEALEEAKKIPLEIPDDEFLRRKDCRNLLTVTIDGENAKDFDDAISIIKLDSKNYRLYVHIADVSNYILGNSHLDKEAYKRGTSVYFIDRVIPMLPQKISNEVCSLKAKEDRLTVTVEMDFDSRAKLLRYDTYNSVINSNERMTYTQIKKILEEKDENLEKRYDYLLKNFFLMKELCIKLNKKREAQGSIDFDLPEPDLILNQEGRIEKILEADRNIAHRIIEEFMLIANVVVANHIYNAGVPSIYRVHEKPDPEKMMDFNEFIHNFGYSIEDTENVNAKTLQNLLNSARGKPEEKLINHVLLRSMKQAVYSEKKLGHFCLAFDCYTHFTSPIRRYPDLIIHRILKSLLNNRSFSNDKIENLKKILPPIAKHSSLRERIAEDAEREIVDIKKVHFMMDKIGENYTGFITGVTSFGIFVELEDIFVEGLVHVTSMKDDYYIFHEKKHSLIGENKRKVYRIGDKVDVKVENVSLGKRHIDFNLAEKS